MFNFANLSIKIWYRTVLCFTSPEGGMSQKIKGIKSFLWFEHQRYWTASRKYRKDGLSNYNHSSVSWLGTVLSVKRLFSFCSEIHARRFPVPWVSPNLHRPATNRVIRGGGGVFSMQAAQMQKARRCWSWQKSSQEQRINKENVHPAPWARSHCSEEITTELICDLRIVLNDNTNPIHLWCLTQSFDLLTWEKESRITKPKIEKQ